MELSQGGRGLRENLVQTLCDFFGRDLIAIPLIKKYPHSSITSKCNLRAATLELDTASYPNIEFIAGARLSVYPPNPSDHVSTLMKHLSDDISGAPEPQSALVATSAASGSQSVKANAAAAAAASSTSLGGPVSSGVQQHKQRGHSNSHSKQHQQQQPQIRAAAAAAAADTFSGRLSKLVSNHKGDSLRVALTYLYDITAAPSRDLLRIMAENCHGNKEHKARLIALSSTDEQWERWICSQLRTLKSTLDEFSSVRMSAKALLSELSVQVPRQYSVSSIKSSKRFRAEIMVFEHRFAPAQIATSLRNIKERDQLHQLETMLANGTMGAQWSQPLLAVGASPTSTLKTVAGAGVVSETTSSMGVAGPSGTGAAIRSIRSVNAFAASPISTHQVKRVPSYSGPLMSLYAASSLAGGSSTGLGNVSASSLVSGAGLHSGAAASSEGGGAARKRLKSSTSDGSLISQRQQHSDAGAAERHRGGGSASAAAEKQQVYEGLCSSYLLNLRPNDYIVCEFVENPRFTLKGNRERPIMMIGQDVGVVAFRPFWQQRSLEHDRAQVFYTMFKDLSPKKFGDMQLVCITGNRCKIEDLFKREISGALANKIISTATYINRSHLLNVLDMAAAVQTSSSSQTSSLGSSRSLGKAARATPSQAPTRAPNQHHQRATQRAPPTTRQTNQSAAAAASVAASVAANAAAAKNDKYLPIESRDLIELGNRLYKLLVENNGCLYTCCDLQMTQAIEILLVESIFRNSNGSMSRERIMALLPIWKGRGKVSSSTSTSTSTSNQSQVVASERPNQQVARAPQAAGSKSPAGSGANSATNINQVQINHPQQQQQQQQQHHHTQEKFLFALENPFESAQIVQEIYDTSI